MIEPNTPGAASGLEEGDLITSMNNEPVKTMTDAKRIGKEAEDGVFGVRFQRKGQKMFVIVREDGKAE
jgi:S1-C subfamily serine protease